MMPHAHIDIDIDDTLPPFDRYTGIQRLAPHRSGHGSEAHVRHQLYAGRDRRSPAGVLIKVTSRPGLVYQHNLTNEIESLTTINRALPTSPYFPVVRDHGRLRDGRVYLVTSLFDELPLATSIGEERIPARLVSHLRTTIEIAKALTELHGLPLFHVDLNPMNVLYRREKDRPVIRIVDFESSYDAARHSTGLFYSPPTTPGYSAPEVSHRPPDARSDLFSLGAVLYTMVAGYGWTWEGSADRCVEADRTLDPDLRGLLLTAVAADPDRRAPSVDVFRQGVSTYLERIWPGRSW